MADTNTNMTVATTSDYWISPNALHIERNAMSNPDYIQASCVSGAQILVYIKDIISYDAGHNYRRWYLQASPTVFNTHTEKYVYVAIPRNDTQNVATVVFPSELLDIYGKNEKEEQIGSENYYYIFLQGILSSSGDNGTEPRDWLKGYTVKTGYLSSDEAINAGLNESEWYQYNSFDNIVTFLKDITMKADTKFRELFAKAVTIVSGGYITFEGQTGELKGIANAETPVDSEETIVTPKYMDDKALSKSHNDKTDFDIELKNLCANGAVDIFGNLTARSGLTVGTYTKGIEGAHVDFYGNAEFESIAARSFLEVPELRYNRTTITVGNRWQTQGAGIIEKVWAGDNADNADIKTELALTSLEGVAKLKLEDGEVGAIALNDKCQGVFHFIGKNNDPSTTDSKDGNFHFAGFTTIYFLIKEIYTAETLPASVRAKLADGESISENQFFRYELRAATCAGLPTENRNRWTDTSHPQPTMNFAAYANATNADRQASRLTTTTYQLNLAGMTDWTYTQGNIMLIIGWLDGFSIIQRIWDNDKKEFVEVTKELHGEGIGTGNIYMWGKIDQFDRAPSLVAQQLYFHSSPSLAEKPEGITVDATHTKPSLNGWQKEPITPSPTDRFVWQQWLYSYSDGTYTVGEVTLLSSDPTAFTLVLNKNIISVAVSDWYDPANPDDIEFDVSAQMFSGATPLVIERGTVAYSKDTSGNVKLEYQSTLSEDGKTISFHVRLSGFVGVSVDGVTPEDAFLIFTAATSYGSASATATIAQNREGEDGQNGEPGKDGVPGMIGRTSEWHEGVTYHNDEGLNVTLRYLDIVTVTATNGTFELYQCRQTHTATADTKPSEATSELWVPVNKLTTPIYTPLLLADNAVLRFGQANRFLIMNTEGKKVQGCITGVDDPTKPMAWFGGETADGANFSLGYDGSLTCRAGTFNNINVQSGTIAGFKVIGNGLTNDPFTNDASVIFRNDSQKTFAGIGGNVLPLSTQVRSVACFKNEDKNDQWGLGVNYAMILSAKNSDRNYAFCGSGNGVLNGWIGGFAFHKYTISAANLVFDGDLVLNMKKANQFIVHCDYKNSGIALPKLSDVRQALDIDASIDFCIQITVMADLSNSESFEIYGRNKTEGSSGSYPWNTEELPLLTTWDNDNWNSMTMNSGDSVVYMLIYDSTRTQTLGGFTTKYTARMINRQN